MSETGAASPATTVESDAIDQEMRGRSAPVAGLVQILVNRRPAQRVFRLGDAALELGRLELSDTDDLDSMISRAHVRVAHEGDHWVISDLSSRNGTFVNGQRINGEVRAGTGTLIRAGGALLLAVADVLPFRQFGVDASSGVVVGPGLRTALEEVKATQRVGAAQSLLIAGESGSGKELAARAFHLAGPRPEAAFTAVNCATIPKDLAERLLFGSRRGAYSGATDAPGYVQASDGGTLFLDEIAELPLEVQSKLLRLLETRQVLRLGATQYEKVDLRVCAATWRDLRKQVALGTFREDLYFRIGRPQVRLPPLRERLEEVPWHIQQVLEECGAERISVSSAFVEACALRIWPGNVRELRAEVRRAVSVALVADARVLAAEDLNPDAGIPLVAPEVGAAVSEIPNDEYAAALRATSGNVSQAAQQLSVHRNKVRRWLERHGVDARVFKRPGKPTQG